MASPTKTRRLPAWAAGSVPQHAQPTGKMASKQISQQEQSASCQQQVDDISERTNSPSTGDIAPTFVKSGTNPPVQDIFKLMEGVIFTVSGLVNPERTEVRKMALDMGAEYRPSWSIDSTLLVCPLTNTPTFNQVQASGGTIVHKDWIKTCYNQKELVAIEPYFLHVGKPWKTGNPLDESTDIGVASAECPSPKRCEGVRPKSTVRGGCESQTTISPKKASKQPVNSRGTGMVKQTSGALNNLASPVDVQQWVLEDLAATLTWLEQQNDRPEEDQLEAVAAQGLLLCLQDTVRSLQENQGLSMVMDNWAFIPRAVRELAVYEKGGQALNEQLIAEGERFRVIYESQLKKLGFGTPSVQSESRDTKMCKDESRPAAEILKSSPVAEEAKDVDDDATEIMSDADSRDAADFDSDGTEELDEGEVAVCKEKILQTFGID